MLIGYGKLINPINQTGRTEICISRKFSYLVFVLYTHSLWYIRRTHCFEEEFLALKWLELIAEKINSWIFSCWVAPAGTYFLLVSSIYKYLVVECMITYRLLHVIDKHKTIEIVLTTDNDYQVKCIWINCVLFRLVFLNQANW